MADHLPSTVRAAREALGLTYAKAVDLINAHGLTWHPSTLQKTEQGTRALRAAEVIPMASALGLHPMALLGADPGAPTATYLHGWRAGRDAALRRITAAVQEIAHG